MKSLACTLAFVALALPSPGLVAQGIPEQEPNGDLASANPHASGSQSRGALSAGDEDWFSVVVPSDSDLRAWTAPGFGNQCGDTLLALLDDQGQLILEVDDGSPASHGHYSLLEAGDLAGGTYYLRVRGADAQAIGTYSLDVMVMAAGLLVPEQHPVTAVAEAPEPNDPRLSGSTTTAGPPWAVMSGNISSPGWSASFLWPGADYDFYKVYLPTPGLLTLTTAAGPAPAAGDTVLHLCDSMLNVLAFDDDSGPAFYALLTYQVTAPAVLFVVIHDYGTGNYELGVDFQSPMPTGAATVSVLAGGCGPWGGVPRLDTRWTNSSPAVRVERPVLGTGYYVDLTNAPANSVVARLFNLLPRQWPLSLAPWGAPGCNSEVEDPFIDFSVTDGNGVDFWGLAIPADTTLIGVPIEKQTAVLDPAANALGVRMSNRVSSVLGIGF